MRNYSHNAERRCFMFPADAAIPGSTSEAGIGDGLALAATLLHNLSDFQ